jgi:TRAP-type C4-dicarboxylate transport system permease small subunit
MVDSCRVSGRIKRVPGTLRHLLDEIGRQLASMGMKRDINDRGILGRIARLFEAISIGCLGVISLLIFIQIVMRNFFSIAFVGIEEVARLAHVTLVFLLVPLLFREGQHVTIDFIYHYVPQKVGHVLRAFAIVATAIYGVLFLISEFQFMSKTATVPSPGLGVPNLVFFAGAYIGMALLVLTAVEQFIRLIRGTAKGRVE